MSDFDWTGFTDAVVTGVTGGARRLLAEASGETPYALALTGFYAEATSIIELPYLTLGTEETSPEPDLRFSSGDWTHQDFEWFATEPVASWAERLQQEVDGLPLADWEEAHHHFEDALLTAMLRVTSALVADGVLPATAVCFLEDEEQALLRRSVTEAERAESFARPAVAQDAEAALAALSTAGRVQRLAEAAELLPGEEPPAIDSERAYSLLVAMGAEAVPVGIRGLDQPGSRWIAAMLLADLHQPTPQVLDALRAHLTSDDTPDDHWVAAALARLGAGRELLDRADLPRATVARGVAAPYRPFRDDSAAHLPLDYGLLAAALARDDLARLLADEFRPGSGECTIDAADLPGAMAGLESPHPIVRRHAVAVLGEAVRPLGSIKPGQADARRHHHPPPHVDRGPRPLRAARGRAQPSRRQVRRANASERFGAERLR